METQSEWRKEKRNKLQMTLNSIAWVIAFSLIFASLYFSQPLMCLA